MSNGVGELTKNRSGYYRYTYNGKEYLDELDINLHDYGFRYYDPAIARFTTIDPLAETNHHQSGYVYADNNPIKFIDFMGLASAYNWDSGRYEDDDGNEISWNDVQNEYGLNNSVVQVSLLNSDSDLSTSQLVDVIGVSSSIFESNGLDGIVSYKIASSEEEYYNSGVGTGLTLGYEFKKGRIVPKGRTSWIQSDWGSDQNLDRSFINLRTHMNSDRSFNTGALGYTLAHETLHGLMGKASHYMTGRRYDISKSDDNEGHFNHFPNLLNGGTSQYGDQSSIYILYEHYIKLKNLKNKYRQSIRP